MKKLPEENNERDEALDELDEFTEEDFDAALYKATRKIDIEGGEDDEETDRDD